MRKYFILFLLLIFNMPLMAMRFKGTVDGEPVMVELYYDDQGARMTQAWGSVLFINVSNNSLELEGTCVVYGREDTGYEGYPIFNMEEYLHNGKVFGQWTLYTYGKTMKGEIKLVTGKTLQVNLRRIK